MNEKVECIYEHSGAYNANVLAGFQNMKSYYFVMQVIGGMEVAPVRGATLSTACTNQLCKISFMMLLLDTRHRHHLQMDLSVI